MQNKKGDVTDGIVFIFLIFFLAVSFVAVGFIISQFSLVVSTTPLNQSTAAPKIISSLDNLSTNGINKAFAFLFAFLIIAMMMTAFMVRVHPAWIFLYIIFLAIAILLAVLLSNAFNTMINNNALSSIANQQTMIVWVMRHSVKIIIGAVALSMIILFAKPPERSDI